MGLTTRLKKMTAEAKVAKFMKAARTRAADTVAPLKKRVAAALNNLEGRVFTELMSHVKPVPTVNGVNVKPAPKGEAVDRISDDDLEKFVYDILGPEYEKLKEQEALTAAALADEEAEGEGDKEADAGKDGSSEGDAATDGSTDGSAEGDATADKDGDADADGDKDGDAKDGEADGDADGEADGDADGEADGDADGEADGDADGEADGDADGEADGDADGEADGDADGEADGSDEKDGAKDDTAADAALIQHSHSASPSAIAKKAAKDVDVHQLQSVKIVANAKPEVVSGDSVLAELKSAVAKHRTLRILQDDYVDPSIVEEDQLL